MFYNRKELQLSTKGKGPKWRRLYLNTTPYWTTQQYVLFFFCFFVFLPTTYYTRGLRSMSLMNYSDSTVCNHMLMNT